QVESVGYYSIAEQVYKALQSLFMPVYQSLFPYMAHRKDFRTYKKVVRLMMALLFLTVPIAYFLYPYFVTVVSTPEFLKSVGVFNVFLFVLSVNLFSSLLGYPLLVALDKTDIANRSIFLGAGVYFLFALLLWLDGGVSANTIVICTLLAEFSILAYRSAYLLRVRTL
ncbi:MAG: hypothetical protein AAF662_03695, partial [Pseudomonadota bacterium]